jgi:hypothetical protein
LALLGDARRRGCNRRTDDQRNHAGAISAGSLEPLDELFHLPDLDLQATLSAHTVTGNARNARELTFFSASLALGSLMVKNCYGKRTEVEREVDFA